MDIVKCMQKLVRNMRLKGLDASPNSLTLTDGGGRSEHERIETLYKDAVEAKTADEQALLKKWLIKVAQDLELEDVAECLLRQDNAHVRRWVIVFTGQQYGLMCGTCQCLQDWQGCGREKLRVCMVQHIKAFDPANCETCIMKDPHIQQEKSCRYCEDKNKNWKDYNEEFKKKCIDVATGDEKTSGGLHATKGRRGGDRRTANKNPARDMFLYRRKI